MRRKLILRCIIISNHLVVQNFNKTYPIMMKENIREPLTYL